MNLKHQPEVDRKTAQIKRMMREFNYLILVLVGENSRQHVTLLKHEIKDFETNGDLMGGGQKIVRVIEVKNGNGNQNGNDKNKDGGDRDDGDESFFPKMPKIEMPKLELPSFRF